jgi:tetratricopeptide (TPR) repeat protein
MDAGYLFRPGSDEDQIYRAIIDGLDLGADNPAFPLRFPAHYAASVQGGRQISEVKLARDLVTVFRATGTPFVLLFDECNVLAQNRVTLEMLRNVFMSTPGYLLVLTGTPAMFPLFDEVFSPIIRQFKKIPVEPFKDSEETAECIREPLKTSGLQTSEIVLNPYRLGIDVHQLSGGRPYEIQLLCHFMFRRVQERRAEQMALTANVIDDVLRELDLSASHPGASRPLLQAVQNLDQRELAALGILTQSDGDATLDELWFANQLSIDGTSISRQELAAHLGILTARGILAINDSEKICFTGDEFERVYISYVAESRDLTVRIENTPYTVHLGRILVEILESISNSYCPMSADGLLRVEEALQALLSDNDQDLRDDTDTVHPWILDAAQSGCLRALRLTLVYGSRSVLAWVPSPDDHTRTEISQLTAKIDALGGTLTVAELTFDVPTEEDYITHLLSRADQNTLVELGSHHSDQASDAYVDGDSIRTWKEVSFALHFLLEEDEANNIGYILLSAGRFEEATALFNRCLNSKDLDTQTAALALYNRAICRLASMQLKDAHDGLEEAQARLNSDTDSSGRYECKCLFVPSVVEDHYILVEQADPELSEAIVEAQRALSSADATISAIEIRPVAWPITKPQPD